MWALGDYHRFATSTVWQLGPVLVEACGISAAQRVLDVAAGTGNVAIRAARRGATVVASDLTPANFEAGRRAAAADGVELEWREADAEALPFKNWRVRRRHVVLWRDVRSGPPRRRQRASAGVPAWRHDRDDQFHSARQRARVLRLLGHYAPPPPPGARPPLLWGDEDHVRALFGNRIASLEMTRREYVETAASPREYYELFQQTFGPMVAIRASLADQPDRPAALERDFLAFVRRSNRATTDRVEIPYEYLLVVARKPLA